MPMCNAKCWNPAYQAGYEEIMQKCAENFQEIADATGGEQYPLDMQEADNLVDNSLIDNVCKIALEGMGGAELVKKYVEYDWSAAYS